MKKRVFWKVLGAILLALCLLVAVAPSIASTAVIRNYFINRTNSSIPGKISVQEASFGWFSGAEISNVAVKDPEGREVFSLKKLRVKTSLLSLITKPSECLEVTVEKPAVTLIEGKNRGDYSLLRAFGETAQDQEKSEKKESTLLPISNLQVTEGSLVIKNEVMQQPREVVNFSCKAVLQGLRTLQATANIEVLSKNQKGSCTIQADAQNIRHLRRYYKNKLSKVEGGESPDLSMQCTVTNFPVDVIDSIATAIDPRLQGVIVEAIGQTLNAKISHRADKELALDLHIESKNVKGDLALKTEQGALSVKNPGLFSWQCSPELVQALHRFSSPLKSWAITQPISFTCALQPFSFPLPLSKTQAAVPIVMTFGTEKQVSVKHLGSGKELQLTMNGEIETKLLQEIATKAKVQILTNGTTSTIALDATCVNPGEKSAALKARLQLTGNLPLAASFFIDKQTECLTYLGRELNGQIQIDCPNYKEASPEFRGKAHFQSPLFTTGGEFQIRNGLCTIASYDVAYKLQTQNLPIKTALNLSIHIPRCEIPLENPLKTYGEAVVTIGEPVIATLPKIGEVALKSATLQLKKSKAAEVTVTSMAICNIANATQSLPALLGNEITLTTDCSADLTNIMEPKMVSAKCVLQSHDAQASYCITLPVHIDFKQALLKGQCVIDAKRPSMLQSTTSFTVENLFNKQRIISAESYTKAEMVKEHFPHICRLFGIENKAGFIKNSIPLELSIKKLHLPLDAQLGTMLDAVDIDFQMHVGAIAHSTASFAPTTASFYLAKGTRHLTFDIASRGLAPNPLIMLHGTVKNLWNETGLQPDQSLIEMDAEISNLPLDIMNSLPFLKKAGEKAEALFGKTIEARFSLKADKLATGSLAATIKSPQCQTSFDATIGNGQLLLTKPLTLKLALHEAAGRALLKDVTPLLATSLTLDHPIELFIDNRGFSIPIKNFSLQKVQIQNAKVDLGKLTVEKGGALETVTTLLQIGSGSRMQLWFTPIFFEVRNGVLICKRADTLLDNNVHIATWGTIDLFQDRVNMVLAVFGDAPQKSYVLETLGPNEILQLPLQGTTSTASIDKMAATAKIAALQMRRSDNPTQLLIGSLVGLAASVKAGDEEAVPPPTTQPFPWQKK